MTWTYRSEYVNCGKQCRKCPHGPYWYRYQRNGKRVRREYVGKVNPFGRTPGLPGIGDKQDRREDILDADKATEFLACEILGVPEDVSLETARKAYRDLAFSLHPDCGGDHKEFVYVGAAWSYLAAVRNW